MQDKQDRHFEMQMEGPRFRSTTLTCLKLLVTFQAT